MRERIMISACMVLLMAGTAYAGYSYSYPHKTSYRRLAPPRRSCSGAGQPFAADIDSQHQEA